MNLVIAIQQVDEGWEAQFLDLKTRTPAIDPATGNAFLLEPRKLDSVSTNAGRFPLPPREERPEPTDDLSRMTSGADANLIAKHFQKTVTQSIDQEAMRAFGSYLFRTLIGEQLWRRLLAAAGATEIELILSWSPQLRELTRLPWEMMFGAKDFLVAETRVALAREVAGSDGTLRQINSPPRVLFVIASEGSEGDFDDLKPGAEYFGLLRSVRKKGLGLNIYPLIAVTAEKLAIAVKRFRPDVVHFVCHGYPDGSLDLMNLRQGGDRIKTTAEGIHRLLHPRDAPDGYKGPQIVVLNSCHSANSGGITLEDAGQVNFPMAIKLVEMGVPVVLGMAGEIANQACRLFSRTFYESLLTDGMLPRAAAKGRYAALTSEDGLKLRRLDWALPTLFVSPLAAGTQLTIVPNPTERAWQDLAEMFAPEEYRAYYARLDLLRLSGLLMLDESEQREVDLTVQQDRQFLGISTPKTLSGKLGRSWAVRDLASLAARNGHIPLVIEKGLLGERPPLTPESLAADFLMKAARITLRQLKKSAPDSKWTEFQWTETTHVLALRKDEPPTPQMSTEVASIYVKGDGSERLDMLTAAIRLDLIQLQAVIRSALERPESRLLLIFDDVHRMGDAALFLFNRLFGLDGLRIERENIRVIFALSLEPERDDQTSAIEAAKEFLESGFTSHYKMGEFREPTETRLAYEHFLLNWRDEGFPHTLVPATENAAHVQWLFKTLQGLIGGVPSNLRARETLAVLRFAREGPQPKALRDATDEDLLKRIT